MKKMKYTFAIIGLAILTISCSVDDGPTGGGGDGEPVNVTANLFVTSNTKNTVLSFDFTSNYGILIRPMSMSGTNNEGVYYDKEEDELVLASREQHVLNTYSNISEVPSNSQVNPSLSSDSELDSPRDLAVSEDFYIVSDNTDLDNDPNTDEGRFLVFKRDENGYTLRNTVTVDYAVWGIELIGSDLYTVVDKSADVAVLKNFLSTYTTDATATSDKRIEIDGITRIHGITQDKGTVVLTDIGDPENDKDGAFHIIKSFTSKFDALPDGDILDISGNQVRVSGFLSELGNPVAAAFDYDTGTVFIAERTNDGGKVLFYDQIGIGGNVKPTLTSPLEGASSLYFAKKQFK
ncbi:hypothetical protein [Aequorivita marina]|uniref:hypothetical protein n=1 Tax=Aequorivita marina TaxID=3073654 RepID=UPI0028751699|nr:hypothetical protein [Aequorivita sp. S2608]MDS1297822.1 hypothetical protein [Aequorivita sp. S2608]